MNITHGSAEVTVPKYFLQCTDVAMDRELCGHGVPQSVWGNRLTQCLRKAMEESAYLTLSQSWSFVALIEHRYIEYLMAP